jgi:hypothetical protein
MTQMLGVTRGIDSAKAPAWYNKGMTLKALCHNDEAEVALARARELGYEE